MSFNFAQTFYVDPNTVGNASSVHLTSIDLYFKSKPDALKNISGINYPGVKISICETINDAPDLTNEYQTSRVRVEHPAVNAGPNPDIPTVFIFPSPVPLATGKKYAILISFDDANFVMWTAKTGERVFGTNSAFPGVTNFAGSLFSASNSGTWVPINSSELRFKVNIASFTSNTATYQVTAPNYEFITYDSGFQSFVGGEHVFVNTALVTGNVSFVSSSNTVYANGANSFSASVAADDYVVLVSGNTQIVRQVSTVNSTAMVLTKDLPLSNLSARYFKSVVGTVNYFKPTSNTLYLVDSNANSTVYFNTNTTIVGEISGATANIVSLKDISVHEFLPEVLVYAPPLSTSNLTYNFAYANSGGGYAKSDSNVKRFFNNQLEVVANYPALMLSRSNEVRNSNSLFTNHKSVVVGVTLGMNHSNTGLYQSPMLYNEKMDFFFGNNNINNDVTNENGPTGNALCKHITTKITFDQGLSAEGVFAYVTAYKPANTDIKVYAKLHNAKDPESFTDKDWTLLTANNLSNSQISSSVSNTDYIDMVFNLPSAPVSSFTANGTVTVSSGSTNLVGLGTNFGADLVAGDVIKVYSLLVPTNYFVASVLSVTNTTLLVMDSSFTNASILGTGFGVDHLSPNHTAFINPQNSNICRYYNGTFAQYDTFDTMQYKIVLLADSPYVTPRVTYFRAIGVTA